MPQPIARLVLGLVISAACGCTGLKPVDAGPDAGSGALDAGPDAGPDAGLDAGQPDAGPRDLGLNGRVNAAVHLGNSWYLGGNFTRGYAVPAPRILPVDFAGSPVATCRLGTGFDGPVFASLVVGQSLYVGGFFSSYDGVPAKNIAKLDKTTCVIDAAFNPAGGGFDLSVNTLATLGTSLYVGGSFTAYRGVAGSATRLAKLDLTTGALDTAFSPAGAANNGFGASVNALAVSGASLYVGGQFLSSRGGASTPQRIAKLDAVTGVNDATFCPDGTGFGGSVNALLVAGNSLYVGGSFTSYRGGTTNRLAKLDLSTGAIDTSFSPPGANGFDQSVLSLATLGTSLYVGGTFGTYNVGNVRVNALAKLDLSTGSLDTTFSPPAANGVTVRGFPGSVRSVAVSGSSLWVAGQFTSYRGGAGNAQNIAKLDAMTGVLDQGLLGFAQAVQSVQVSGSTVWVAGVFTAYGGEPLGGLVKVDDITFEVDRTFSPVANNGFDGDVLALASSGTSLFVGGSFTSYRGVADSANRIAKLDATTGAMDTAFSPPGARANGFSTGAAALTMVVDGTALYVGLNGGPFSYRDLAVPAGLVKLDLAGGLDVAFNVGVGTAGVVNALAVADTSVYVGGSFSAYRGGSAKGLAKLDKTTGALDTTFSPPAANGVDGTVRALAIAGPSLYLAGSFSTYRDVVESASNLAKVDLTTGALDAAFSPPGAGLNGFTFASAASGGTEARALTAAGTSLYVGGIFDSYRGVAASTNALAKLDLTTGALDMTFSPPGATLNGFANATQNYLNAFASSGSSLLLCGDFNRYRGAATPRRNAVAVNLVSGARQ